MIPVGLILFILIAVAIKFLAGNVEEKNNKKIKEFLRRESEVTIVPSSKLDEIEFMFPKVEIINYSTANVELAKKLDIINNLSSKKIANFTSMSNYDLKKTYGTNNFDKILEYQSNYDTYTKEIVKASEMLLKEKNYSYAERLLKSGVDMNTDISKNYTLLAQIYINQNKKNELFDLLDCIKSNKNISSQSILNQISSLQGGKR